MAGEAEEVYRRKKALDSSFEVINVINKTYADSTVYELNDTLIYLNKAINATKQKNKELVKRHFTKFVQCRVVLEEIWLDMKKKGIDKSISIDLENYLEKLKQKYSSITSRVLNQDNEVFLSDQKQYYEDKFKILINVKENLNRNLQNLEIFAETYEEAYKQFCTVPNSKYFQGIWKSIQEERLQFLERVYTEIRTTTSFTEALYYFNLYFRVSESKSERKIMNTLLVNFKENSFKSLDNNLKEKGMYVDTLIDSYLSMVKYLDDDLKEEGTQHFFYCIGAVLQKTNVLYCKIVCKKLTEVGRNLDMPTELKRNYFWQLKSTIKSLINVFFEQIDVSDIGEEVKRVTSLYENFTEMLNKNEGSILQSRMLRNVAAYYDLVDCKEVKIFEKTTKELSKLKKVFSGDYGAEFDRITEERQSEVINYIAQELCVKIKRADNDEKILIEATRIMYNMPILYRVIIPKVYSSIKQRLIALHFLSKIIGCEKPSLSAEERERVEYLNFQFGFLLD